jgi:hypothetical protein
MLVCAAKRSVKMLREGGPLREAFERGILGITRREVVNSVVRRPFLKRPSKVRGKGMFLSVCGMRHREEGHLPA